MDSKQLNGPVSEDLGKLVLRLSLGVMILLHGIAKVIGGVDGIAGMLAKHGIPSAAAYLVYAGEVIGPILIILGIWTTIGALLIVANMVVAVLLVHMHEILTLTKTGGWALELQGMFLFAAIAVALLGPGRFRLGGAQARR
jgi:putative oxidoreductase